MTNFRYLKLYQFNRCRTIGISTRNQIIDEGFCVSNPYKSLAETEEALKKFVSKVLAMDYEDKIELQNG